MKGTAMTTTNDLFCTPEQGRRLQELVPELTSAMEWIRIHDADEFEKLPYFSEEWDKTKPCFDEFAPALTLQELRDVAMELTESKRIGKDESGLWIEDWMMIHNDATAPELAAWVIERLEEVV